ncbi:class I SAM-dependent methyltransferase [Parabacteroides sp. OttesenSCG-928-N08]|nr:class I SAM-dependent methyltransferase [Parabacteroides sp. OttesenSCG-928-N08]
METNKKEYDARFYQGNRSEKKLNSVDTVLAEAMKVLPKVSSAVDFGCGVGTWLAGLKKFGVKEVKGLDGPWVKKDLLVIPQECFVETDFDKAIHLDKKYDMAISIEVAEHLLEQSAEGFIKALTDASDMILFSAAIPFQGGANHVNEQWPPYWNKLFNSHGFIAVDCLRRQLWDKEEVLDFHRQNVMLFVRAERLQELHASENDFCIDRPPMPFVDHARYLRMVKNDLSQMSFFRIFIQAGKWMIVRVFGKKFCKAVYNKIFKK